jgi:ubiquinone/menaquinone biosynthesis C-methylase UbiE
MAGDFEQIAKSYAEGAQEFVRGLDLKPGMRVLDVACGTGNLALPAARLGADVTGIDIAPNLIEQARENAKREGLNVKFEEGDAENMPYADGSFDAVITMFGAMFTPRPEVTAAELKRVCRPGGFVAMANWTPAGFIGQLFKVIGRHVPPPAGLESPARWGVPMHLAEWFQDSATRIHVNPKMFVFRYRSPQHWVDVFRSWYGPVLKAFAALDEERRTLLEADIIDLIAQFNESTDGTVVVPAAYLEVVVDRK